MNERQMKELVRNCVKEYYAEDKKILIDISVLQCTCITYFLYNQIFFGNKVLFFKETLNEMQKIRKEEIVDVRSEILIRNAGYLLEKMEKDERENYRIIKAKGGSKVESICTFLKENEDGIYLLSDNFLYEELRAEGFLKQLNFVEIGKREVNPFRNNKLFKFETVGAIQVENNEMVINQKEKTIIKVYDKRGFEKNDKKSNIKVGNYVLLIGQKGQILSFNLYQIVSKHTRNHAVRIIWTDLEKGQRTNKYISRLPYKFKKMIMENVEQ